MNDDLPTLRRQLGSLSHRERQTILSESVASAVQALPEPDRRAIRALARDLADQIRNLGDQTALQIIAAIGMLWVDGDKP